MTSTVTFHLAGPMQAWSRAHRTHGGGGARPTQRHPTKTGVIGLVANALGRTRTDPITDLAALLYAVRVDQPGTPAVDFHTAGGGHFPLRPNDRSREYAAARKTRTAPNGQITAPPTGRTIVPTHDHYLADAAFTAALTGTTHLVEQVADALTRPARLLHLGRAAYPLTGDLRVTITEHTDPVAALSVAPRTGDVSRPLTVHAETLPGPVVTDQPVTYDTRHTIGRREGTTRLDRAPAAPDWFTAGSTQ